MGIKDKLKKKEEEIRAAENKNRKSTDTKANSSTTRPGNVRNVVTAVQEKTKPVIYYSQNTGKKGKDGPAPVQTTGTSGKFQTRTQANISEQFRLSPQDRSLLSAAEQFAVRGNKIRYFSNAKAGNRAAAQAAHEAAEGIRSRHGYTGGVTGNRYSALNPTSYRQETAEGRSTFLGANREQRERDAAQFIAANKAAYHMGVGGAMSDLADTARMMQIDAARDRARLQAISDIRGGGEVNISMPKEPTGPNRWEQMIRQGQQEKAFSEEGMSAAEKWLNDVYISGVQSLPTTLAAFVPGAGTAAGLAKAATLLGMGASAAGNRRLELTDAGYDFEKAYWDAQAAGAIEALTESIGVERLSRMVAGQIPGTVLKNILEQGMAEGAEEGLSYVLNLGYNKARNLPGQEFDAKEMLSQIAAGGLLGAVHAGAGVMANSFRGVNYEDQSPEGKVRNEIIRTWKEQVSQAREIISEAKQWHDMMDQGSVSREEGEAVLSQLSQQLTGNALMLTREQLSLHEDMLDLEDQFLSGAMSGQAVQDAQSQVRDTLEAAARDAAANRTENRTEPADGRTGANHIQTVAKNATVEAATSRESRQVEDPVQRAAAVYGRNGARAIVTAGEKVPGYDNRLAFADAFNQVYIESRRGARKETVNRPAALDAAQFVAAYNAGVADRAAGRNKNAGVDMRDAYVRSMDKRTQRTLDGVARALGVRVEFADEGTILTAGGQEANADIRGNVVTIEKNNPNPVRQLIGHELTHRMQDLSPENYAAFRDYVMSLPGAQAAVDQTLAAYQQAGAFRDGQDFKSLAQDEVAADFAGELFDNSEQLKEFIRQNYENRSLLERVRDLFRELAAKLTGKEKAQADEAVRLLEEALTGATEELRRIDGNDENAAGEGVQTRFALEVANSNEGKFFSGRPDENVRYSIRTEAPPKKTGVAYKVFYAKNGQLYPPMVANPGGKGTPVGVWLNADVGQQALPSKTGRQQVKAGGKGTQGGSGSLAFRPGWHLGDVPQATQFARINPETGKKELVPANFVWAECEYAADVDYQKEAMSYGYTENGKFRHSYAGLPRLPENGFYRYRTNPNPDTVSWIITGAMKVNRILTDAETDAILRENGVEPMKRQGGPMTAERMKKELGIKAGDTTDTGRFSLKTDRDYLSAVERGDMDTAQKMVDKAAKKAGYDIKAYHGTKADFTVFDSGKIGENWGNVGGDLGFYFTPFIDDASGWATEAVGPKDAKKVVPVFLKFNNPLIESDSGWGSAYGQADIRHGDLKRWAREGHHDGIIVMSSDYDMEPGVNGEEIDTVYIAFSPEQIKSADPVTYDDNGDVIPLSERFNQEKGDIRFSLKTDNKGRELSAGQREYFQNSTARDGDGNLLTLHHGTPKGGFTVEGAQFSIKGSGGLDAARLLRENQKLRDKVEYWKSQTKRSDRTKADPKEVKKLAKRIATDFSSTMDTDEIAGKLQGIYDGIGKDMTFDQAHEAALALARDMVAQASEPEDYLYHEYEPMRKYFRDTPIVLSAEDRGQVTDYNDFRKAMMGKIRLQNGPISNIDQVYQEIANLWPEWFDEQRDSTSLDQLERIADVLESIYTRGEENLYEGDTEAPAGYLAAEIMDSFWDMPNVKKTYADRAEARLGREVSRRLDMRERYEATLQKVRESRDAKIKAQKEIYLGREKARSQRQKERELRAKIMRHSRDMLNRFEHQTDKKNIPDDLYTTVKTLLESINLSSGQDKTLPSGRVVGKNSWEPTKRTQAFEAVRAKLEAMKDASDENLNLDPQLFGDSSQNITGNFAKLIAMRDIPIAKMNMEQLTTVWDTLKAVEHAVVTYGKNMAIAKYESRKALADAIYEEAKTRRPIKSRFGRNYLLDLQNAYTFFSQFGKSGLDLYRAFRDAQDVEEFRLIEVKDKAGEIVDPKTVKKWKEQRHNFTVEWMEGTENGLKPHAETLTLTTDQIMELYLLMKQPEAVEHLVEGGLYQPKVKGGGKTIQRGTHALRVDKVILQQITAKLNEIEGAKETADKIQALVTDTLSGWGNEASLQAYGYKKFIDPKYWPIRTASEGNMATVDKGNNNAKSIKNIGLAKPRLPHAQNPLDIPGIFDTFDNHATQMIKYSTWLNVMEDAERLNNWVFRDAARGQTGKTMKSVWNEVAGEGAENYWMRLMTDIQNGIAFQHDTEIGHVVNKIISNAKGAAVGANLRVVIQQPTAIMRALMVMNPADLISAGRMNPVKGWNEAKKWAGIAARKDSGSFDLTATGGNGGSFFGQETVLDKLSEISSAGAKAFDALTWGNIWNAAKRQVARENPGLAKGSKEYFQTVAEVFTDVIDQTQVVDGVLQRPQVMRSSSDLMKQVTAFKGEPLMSINMFMRSYNNWRYQTDPQRRTAARKAMGRAAFALAAQAVVNAIAQSVWDGVRDDDDDKKWWEATLAAFLGTDFKEKNTVDMVKNMILNGNLAENLNLTGSTPFAADIYSMIKGYDVVRADADVFAGIWQAAKKVTTDKNTKWYAVANLAAQVGKLFGIPGHTIIRDATGILRTFARETGNNAFLYEIEKAIYSTTSDKNAARFEDIAFKAKREGDMGTYNRIRSDLLQNEDFTEKKFDDAMKRREKKSRLYDPNLLGDGKKDVMEDFQTFTENVTSDKDKYGNVTKSEQDKIIQKIDSYPITRKEKRELYLTVYDSDKNCPW